MCRVQLAVRRLLAHGNGCPAAFACTLYELMALSTMNYALPIYKLQAPQGRLTDQDHRCTIRMCHGMPRSSVWPGHSRKLAHGLRHSRWTCALCATLSVSPRHPMLAPCLRSYVLCRILVSANSSRSRMA
ncbi:hypothetical protein MRX96_042882 [Rhipicephalus microplus]